MYTSLVSIDNCARNCHHIPGYTVKVISAFSCSSQEEIGQRVFGRGSVPGWERSLRGRYLQVLPWVLRRQLRNLQWVFGPSVFHCLWFLNQTSEKASFCQEKPLVACITLRKSFQISCFDAWNVYCSQKFNFSWFYHWFHKTSHVHRWHHCVTEPRGYLGTLCLPEDECISLNAECDSGVCVCQSRFFEKNDICSMRFLFWASLRKAQ